MEYELRFFEYEEWQIVRIETDKVMFQGNLVECNAWFKLNKNGYL